MTKRLSRRAMLRGAGGLAIGLPALDAMFSLGGKLEGTAHAGTTPDGSPRRLIVYLTGFGYHQSTWVSGQGRDFELGRMLAPLEPVKDRCLFLEGINNQSNGSNGRRLSGHPGGVTSLLTGTHTSGDDPSAKGGRVKAPVSSSIDVRIDEALQGQVTHPTYRWSTQKTASKFSDCPFYSHEDRSLRPPVSHGVTSFNELFSDFTPSGDGEVNEELAQKLASRERVFDLVRDDFEKLNKKLNPNDQCRLEQHLESVQGLLDSAGGSSGVGCGVPGEPGNIRWHERSVANSMANFDADIPAIWRVQAEQITMALSCDITRASFAAYGHLVNNDFQIYYDRFLDDQPGIIHADKRLPNGKQHHQCSHLDASGGYRWEMERISHWQALELMHLVELLQQTPDGDGTLFDHTTIIWMNEMGWDHTQRDTKQIIIGDGGGYFSGGQSLKFAGDNSTAHNRLLLNMLHYLGIEDDTFGLANLCSNGPFTEILA